MKKVILIGTIPIFLFFSCGYKKVSPDDSNLKGYIPVKNNEGILTDSSIITINKERADFTKYVVSIFNDLKYKKEEDDKKIIYSVENSPFEYRSESEDDNLKDLFKKWDKN